MGRWRDIFFNLGKVKMKISYRTVILSNAKDL